MTMVRCSLQCRSCLDNIHADRFSEKKCCTCGATAIAPGHCGDPAKYFDNSHWLCDGNANPDDSEVQFIAEFAAYRYASMTQVYARLSALP